MATGDGRRLGALSLSRPPPEYLGAERLLYGEVGEAKAVARFPANSAIDTEIGSTTEFAVRRSDLKRFHLETGLRLDRNGRRP